ncbi:MAG: DUF393 domain-containing protein [Solirubrobacterales bacterium]|nr:DUF393 domain-containing protein [Solirubrobacterales bacterium]
MSDDRGRCIVLWDRDCGFCAWMLAWVLRWDRDRRLRPASIQGPDGDRWLAAMPPERRLASWHLVDEDGEVSSGGRALPAVFRRLPGGAPLAALAALRPPATDAAYDWVAAHRSLLGRPIPAAAKERARTVIGERSD